MVGRSFIFGDTTHRSGSLIQVVPPGQLPAKHQTQACQRPQAVGLGRGRRPRASGESKQVQKEGPTGPKRWKWSLIGQPNTKRYAAIASRNHWSFTLPWAGPTSSGGVIFAAMRGKRCTWFGHGVTWSGQACGSLIKHRLSSSEAGSRWHPSTAVG